MAGMRLARLVIPLVPLLFASPSYSHGHDSDIYWHIDPSVKTCSMVIDPSLTQAQWRKFTREAGTIVSSRSLATAEPLGKLNFTLGIDYSITPVDQRDLAWINTFTHPDENCPLGDQIVLPALRASVGVSDAMDVTGYWTTAPGANYGFMGAEFKYAVLRESARAPAVAVSTALMRLTGVPDFNLSVYSMGLVTSKRMGRVTPYLGFKESVAVGTETTDKVDLNREVIPVTQGFIGAAYSVWKLGIAAEYDVAPVNTFSFLIGFQPRARLP